MSDQSKAEVMPPAQRKSQGTSVATIENEGGITQAMIAKMAADKTFDLNRLEKLIQLYNDERAANDRRKYNVDFVQMKPDLPRVIKTHHNAQTKSTYAKLEDINDAIDPILSQYGFGTSSKVLKQDDNSVTMSLEIRHQGGHVETMELTMPIDDKGFKDNANKTKIQGIASTITQIKKVGFSAMLNISTGDDKDGNREEDETPITIEQAADIDTRVRALGEDYYKRFMAWIKLPATNKIPATKYKDVIAVLTKAEQEAKELAAKAKK